MIRVHATCVALAGCGVLIRGPSGAGKSDLALRLIDGGARLVADDQVEIERRDGHLTATVPAAIAGLIEVRGVGIVRLDHMPSTGLDLVIDLAAPEAIERLPAETLVDLLGVRLPGLTVNPWEPSAAAKVRLAVRTVAGTIMRLR